jgi:hypothetical protein
MLNNKFKVISVAILASISLSACVTTAPKELRLATEHISNNNEVLKYDPKELEEFVFKEQPKGIQKHRYRNICFKIPVKSDNECYEDKLNYSEYVGKKGYFINNKKISIGGTYSKDYLREAVIETGIKIYIKFIESSMYESTYIISIKEHKVEQDKKYAFNKFLEENINKPLVKGSTVKILGAYKLQPYIKISGIHKTSTPDTIRRIRDIAGTKPKHEIRIAELLISLGLNYDEFNQKYKVSGQGKNPLSINISIDKDFNITPIVRTRYDAEDWLFVKSISIAADDFRWKGPKLKTKRDNARGKVWEWSNSYLSEEWFTALQKLSNSNKGTVRFHGRDYYNDVVLSIEQKTEISSLIELYILLKE